MHIISFLGYLIGRFGQEGRYVIVSNDTDFDKVLQYWKESAGADVRRGRSIRYILGGSQAKTTEKKAADKKPAEKKTGAKKAADKKPAEEKTDGKKTTEKKTGGRKTDGQKKVEKELQKALSDAEFEPVVIDEVTAFVNSHYGDDEFLTKIHNDLRKKYENYLEVYEIIKPILGKPSENKTAENKSAESRPAEEKEEGTKKTSGGKGSEKAALNNEIQKVLSKAGIEADINNEVAALAVKNFGEKNAKQMIYRTIISKYGRQKGLEVYNHIKDLL